MTESIDGDEPLQSRAWSPRLNREFELWLVEVEIGNPTSNAITVKRFEVEAVDASSGPVLAASVADGPPTAAENLAFVRWMPHECLRIDPQHAIPQGPLAAWDRDVRRLSDDVTFSPTVLVRVVAILPGERPVVSLPGG